MLTTVKQYIESGLPEVSFDEYFIQYLLDVQDSSIHEEIRFLLNNNSLDVLSIDKLIDTTYRRMLSC